MTSACLSAVDSLGLFTSDILTLPLAALGLLATPAPLLVGPDGPVAVHAMPPARHGPDADAAVWGRDAGHRPDRPRVADAAVPAGRTPAGGYIEAGGTPTLGATLRNAGDNIRKRGRDEGDHGSGTSAESAPIRRRSWAMKASGQMWCRPGGLREPQMSQGYSAPARS